MKVSSYESRFSVGDVLNQTYALSSLVGLGSMAEVWAARHVRTGDVAALKILRHDCPHLAPRLEREHAILSTIRHPGIVRCLGRDVTQGPALAPYLVLEFVEGRPLSRILSIRRKSRARIARAVSPQKLQSWLAPVLGAVGELNRLGVAHRDLKPGNIMIDARGAGKIIDLNLGKMPGSPPLTHERLCGGTAPYSGPEQFESLAKADPRADTFAIAAVMVEALTGVPLRDFERAGRSLDREAIRRTLRGGAAPGEKANQPGERFAIDVELTAVLLASLSPNPAHRPESARVLLDALEVAGGNEALTVEKRLRSPYPVPPLPARRAAPEAVMALRAGSGSPPARPLAGEAEPQTLARVAVQSASPASASPPGAPAPVRAAMVRSGESVSIATWTWRAIVARAACTGWWLQCWLRSRLPARPSRARGIHTI